MRLFVSLKGMILQFTVSLGRFVLKNESSHMDLSLKGLIVMTKRVNILALAVIGPKIWYN